MLANMAFGEHKPAVTVLMDTASGKEIRIVFRAGQEMKAHQAPFPIVVEVVDGLIDFGVSGAIHVLDKGMLIALDADVPHSLVAQQDSVVRLSLHKADKLARLEEVVAG